MKEPLEEPIIGATGTMINPGDRVFTFTQVYGRGTRVWSGVFRGVIRVEQRRDDIWEYFVVERGDGARSKLHYSNMVPAGTRLEDLDDRVI